MELSEIDKLNISALDTIDRLGQGAVEKPLLFKSFQIDPSVIDKNNDRSFCQRTVRAASVSYAEMVSATIAREIQGTMLYEGYTDAILINKDIVFPAIAEYLQKHKNELYKYE